MPKGDIYKVMPKLKQLYTLLFLLIVFSFFSYGCGKKAEPIAPSKKIISTKN
tara:strand:+ start:327 stop:482 length:156 start_codon:yes stop_codon:yes gene_type:complete